MYSAKEILLSEIKPALGCTEPAAIALNAAYLKEFVNGESKIKLTLNTNLVKNAMYVPIPNTGRRYGIKLAFALGFLCGNKNKGLKIFSSIDEICLEKAQLFMENIELEIIKGNKIFIKSESDGCEVVTKGFHDRIIYVKTPDKKIDFNYKNSETSVQDIEAWLKLQKFEKLFELIEREKDFDFIKDAVDMNMALAEIGLNEECALNIGKTFKGDDEFSKILSVTASASDARMEGVNFPAMSLVGSGNHGISATLPVWVYGIHKGYNQKEILKAVALSMLITVYVKLYLGRLSPICGAAFASGCGVAGGIAYLESSDENVSKQAVLFVINTINGIVCDGAKMGCSLKVLAGAEYGYKGALFALEGKKLFNEGILEDSISGSIANLERIKNSMLEVDEEIVNIMVDKLR